MIVADPLAADALLAQADRLLGDTDRTAAERAIDLRRAASGVYYAVYNELSLRAAMQISGCPPASTDPPPSIVANVTRWFTHGALQSACLTVERLHGRSLHPGWSTTRRSAWHVLHSCQPTPLPDDLLALAALVRELLALRHDADYDRVRVFERDEVADAVDAATEAIEAVRRHAATPAYRGFFVLVAMSAPQRLVG